MKPVVLHRTRRHSALARILGFAAAAALSAQSPSLQLGVLYSCATGQGFKVESCSGPGAGATCDVQAFNSGQPGQKGKAPREQVMALIAVCQAQGAAGKQGAAPAAASPQAGPGGFKIGDAVQINTAFGWIDGKILGIRGNSYYVHAQSGADVWKDYPAELHRVGAFNAEDHANGLYELHDKVQVNFEGRWVDSEVVTILGMEYQVKLPGNRVGWAKPSDMRYVTPAAKPPAPKAGQPPKPGLTSCAGKIEGRYAPSAGLGGMTIVFRAGKATITAALTDPEEVECWTGGGKVYLHKPGEADDLALEINNDGSLETPFGELKKKGN